MTKYCRKCGNELVDGAKFCSHCGNEENTDVLGDNETTVEFNNDDVIEESEIVENVNNNFSIMDKLRRIDRKWFKVLAVVLLAFIGLICIIVGLRNRKVSEKIICEEIMEFEDFEDMEKPFTIVDCTIYKRDTDKREKYDDIWVAIVARNEYVEYVASYHLSFGLYNDGWELDDIEMTDDYKEYEYFDYYALSVVTEEQVEKDLKEKYQSVIEKYSLEEISVQIEIPNYNKKNKEVNVFCVASAKNADMTCSGTFTLQYGLEMQRGWVLYNSTWDSVTYEATGKPSDSLVSQTTDTWGDSVTLEKAEKTGKNEYTYIYVEHDESTYERLTVDWAKKLCYIFDPDKGGWYLENMSEEIKSVSTNLNGLWQYKQGSEYINLNVTSSDSTKINYDLDLKLVSGNLLAFGYDPVELNEKNLSRNWTYEYDAEEQCIVFKIDRVLFTVTYPLTTDEYMLYYRAYTGDKKSESGFYVDSLKLAIN